MLALMNQPDMLERPTAQEIEGSHWPTASWVPEGLEPTALKQSSPTNNHTKWA